MPLSGIMPSPRPKMINKQHDLNSCCMGGGIRGVDTPTKPYGSHMAYAAARRFTASRTSTIFKTSACGNMPLTP